jgi:DNA replication protein DnaC
LCPRRKQDQLTNPVFGRHSIQKCRALSSSGLADNSVGRVIDTLLRNDLIIIDEVGFAPLDDTGAQLLFRFVSAAYERRALGVASHWPFDQWGRFLPEHTTAVSLLDNRSTHGFP